MEEQRRLHALHLMLDRDVSAAEVAHGAALIVHPFDDPPAPAPSRSLHRGVRKMSRRFAKATGKGSLSDTRAFGYIVGSTIKVYRELAISHNDLYYADRYDQALIWFTAQMVELGLLDGNGWVEADGATLERSGRLAIMGGPDSNTLEAQLCGLYLMAAADPIEDVRRRLVDLGLKQQSAAGIRFRSEAHVYLGTLGIACASFNQSIGVIQIGRKLDTGAAFAFLAATMHGAGQTVDDESVRWSHLQRDQKDAARDLDDHWQPAIAQAFRLAPVVADINEVKVALLEQVRRIWQFDEKDPDLLHVLGIDLANTCAEMRTAIAPFGSWTAPIEDLSGLRAALEDVVWVLQGLGDTTRDGQ